MSECAVAFEPDAFPVPVDSGAVSLVTTDETVVASAVGAHSNFDVWLSVPSAWTSRVTLRLYGRVGVARVLLCKVAIANVARTVGAGGAESGVAIALRGRPCSSVELTCQATAGAVLAGGQFYLQAWHGRAPLAATQGDDPAAAAAIPALQATAFGRTEGGALTQLATDATGMLIMSNPLFTQADRDLIDNATASATASTLCKRGSAGECAFANVRLPTQGSAPSAGSGEALAYFNGTEIVTSAPIRFVGANGVSESLSGDDASSGLTTKECTRPRKHTQTTTSAGAPFVLYSDAVPVSSAVLYEVVLQGRCTSGNDVGEIALVRRQVVVGRGASGAPTLDANFNAETKQRMFTDSASFSGASAVFVITGNNVVLNLTPKLTGAGGTNVSTWEWMVWATRTLLVP